MRIRSISGRLNDTFIFLRANGVSCSPFFVVSLCEWLYADGWLRGECDSVSVRDYGLYPFSRLDIELYQAYGLGDFYLTSINRIGALQGLRPDASI